VRFHSTRAAGLVLLMLLSACQALPTLPAESPSLAAAASTPQTTPDSFRLQSKTRLLEAEQAPVSVWVDRLLFAPGQRFEVGEILVGRGQDQEPFLRRVISIALKGAQQEVFTEEASLLEAFAELDATADAQAQTAAIVLDRRRFQLGPLMIDSALRLQPDFSDLRLRIEKGRALFVRVAPDLKTTWDLTTRVILTPDTPILQPVLVLKPVGEVRFAEQRVHFRVGPVPVSLVLKPSASLDWGHQAVGKLECNGQLNARLKAGVEIRAQLGQKPSFAPFHSFESGGQISQPRLEINGRVLSRLSFPELRIESKIAGMAGPYLDNALWLDGDLNARATVLPSGRTQVIGRAESHLGLTVRAGIPPTRLFGKFFGGNIHQTLLHKRMRELYKAELNYIVADP
jgi:hypothetical protein